MRIWKWNIGRCILQMFVSFIVKQRRAIKIAPFWNLCCNHFIWKTFMLHTIPHCTFPSSSPPPCRQMIQNRKFGFKTRCSNFANVSNEMTRACAIGSYVFEGTWFETMRSGHCYNQGFLSAPISKMPFLNLIKAWNAW